jgi:hypothetical protein
MRAHYVWHCSYAACSAPDEVPDEPCSARRRCHRQQWHAEQTLLPDFLPAADSTFAFPATAAAMLPVGAAGAAGSKALREYDGGPLGQ